MSSSCKLRHLRAILILLVSIPLQSVSSETKSPENEFCEADSCKKPCREYNAKEFKKSRSIFTYFPEGRLGNKISAFLFLYWLKLDFGLDVYYERESYEVLDYIFANIAETKLKILEDELCDWKKFKFEKYEGNVELLGGPEWAKGKAVQLYIDKKNFLRHEIQGGRKYNKKFRFGLTS